MLDMRLGLQTRQESLIMRSSENLCYANGAELFFQDRPKIVMPYNENEKIKFNANLLETFQKCNQIANSRLAFRTLQSSHSSSVQGSLSFL